MQPLTVWFTGLSASGKSTIAKTLHGLLTGNGQAVVLLDGDKLRAGPSRDLDYSRAGRREQLRRAAELAKQANQSGTIALVALISPYAEDRELARDIVGAARFLEIHVATPLAVCEARDPKGLYRQARQGHLAEFTGISAPYQPPASPALRLDTDSCDADGCARLVLTCMAAHSDRLREAPGAH